MTCFGIIFHGLRYTACESAASMSSDDRSHMSQAFDSLPFRCDCFGLSLCHRPRFYWLSWEITPKEGVDIQWDVNEGEAGTVHFSGKVEQSQFLLAGWLLREASLLSLHRVPGQNQVEGRRGSRAAVPRKKKGGYWMTTGTPLTSIETVKFCTTNMVNGDCRPPRRKNVS